MLLLSGWKHCSQKPISYSLDTVCFIEFQDILFDSIIDVSRNKEMLWQKNAPERGMSFEIKGP